MDKSKKGKLIIFSAPSGAGKTTLVRYLMSQIPNLSFSVSAASRKPRQNELDGKDYYFLNVDDFKKKIDESAFIEWEEVYKDHFYGTLSAEVDRIRNKGLHVIFDVDVKGGVNIKKFFEDEALAIFVRPPSIKELEKRLRDRATDSEKDIQTRIDKAAEELVFEKHFDTILVNDDLNTAKKEVIEVVSKFIES